MSEEDLLYLVKHHYGWLKDAIACVDPFQVTKDSLQPLPLYTYEWEKLVELVGQDPSSPDRLAFALNTATPADFVAHRNRHWVATRNNRVLTDTVIPFDLNASIRNETIANMQEFLGLDPEIQ